MSGNLPDPATYVYTGSRTDDALTEKGRMQADLCAERIVEMQHERKITAIFASPLKRAKETAAPIAQALGLEVQIRHNLREIDWGCAEGQLVYKMDDEYAWLEEQIRERYPDRQMRWDFLPVFPGAETFNSLLKRTLSELKDIAEQHREETVLIIGHGRVLKTLISACKDGEERIPYPPNCGIVEFIFSEKKGLQFIKVL